MRGMTAREARPGGMWRRVSRSNTSTPTRSPRTVATWASTRAALTAKSRRVAPRICTAPSRPASIIR